MRLAPAATLICAATLLAACAPPTTLASPRSSAAHPASPSPSATAPYRVPVRAFPTVGIDLGAGFLALPGGSVTPDPAARLAVDATSNRMMTTGSPTLYGDHSGITYDWAIGRWLPVAARQVAADGRVYAYVEAIASAGGTGPPGPVASSVRIHIVDVKSATDTVLYSTPTPPFFTIVGFVGSTIYLSADCVEGCAPDSLKLWQLDGNTRQLTLVSSRRSFDWQITGTIAWMTEYTQASPAGRLLRIDLATGQAQTWFTGSGIELIGLANDGSPLIVQNDMDGFALLRVSAPGASEQIGGGPSNNQFTTAVADGTQTWIGGGQVGATGIFRYTGSGSVQRVSDFAGAPAGLPR